MVGNRSGHTWVSHKLDSRFTTAQDAGKVCETWNLTSLIKTEESRECVVDPECWDTVCMPRQWMDLA